MLILRCNKINYFFYFISFFISSALFSNTHYERPYEHPIVVVIPSYNNEDVCIRNIRSVFDQQYGNYFVIYVDDASTDKTVCLVEQYINDHNLQNKTFIIKNNQRVGSLANVYQAIHLCEPHVIIAQLDGDDYFYHNNVLQRVNEQYQNPDVWLTYGQFIHESNQEVGWAEQVPAEIVKYNNFRDWTWVTTALRTFYAGLFQNIEKEDLFFNGQFYPMSGDLAYMFCLLEQASSHTKFIPEVLYVYNDETCMNDHLVNRDLQYQLGLQIRKNRRYNPVSEPYTGHYESYVAKELKNKNIQKKIYVTPGYWGQLFAMDNPAFNRDDCLRPLYELREECSKLGYQVEQADDLSVLHDADYIIVFEVIPEQIEILKQYPKEKLLLFLWEPPTVLPNNYNVEYHQYFSKIYTFCDDLIDNKNYFKLYYPVMHTMVDDIVPFNNKRLCVSISANKSSNHENELYGLRRKAIEFFENNPAYDFDFFGKFWPEGVYKNYQGCVDKKTNVLKNYKFCICYENIQGTPGYVTEKIFDCFWAGCIPIYLGAPNISQYVPRNCYIDREDFADEQELYEFIKDMNQNEYERYIRNIRKFLDSDKAKRFSKEYFIKTVMEAVIPHYFIPQLYSSMV